MGDSLSKEIFVFVNVEVGSQVRLPPPPNVGIGEEPNVDDNEPNVENDDKDANLLEVNYVNGDEHMGGGGENDDRDANRHDVDDVKDNNVYGLSFENDDWIVDGDDSPNVSFEYNDDTINTQFDENSDNGFSDYQLGDEGYVSSTDSKELEAEVEETHRRGRKKKCNVSDTSRFGVEFNVPKDGNTDWDFCVGMLFGNVDLFRNALKDYIIKTGIKVIRKKNERIRVIVECAVEGC
ncbi:unnamed protein product [Ilex paraguariensis]|uniref:Transposase MuDR plant domain-containing protein n=1 Tax=Ilex paraguariensis TaxID=185542 RepID=A0ABC8T976_9AQUA